MLLMVFCIRFSKHTRPLKAKTRRQWLIMRKIARHVAAPPSLLIIPTVCETESFWDILLQADRNAWEFIITIFLMHNALNAKISLFFAFRNEPILSRRKELYLHLCSRKERYMSCFSTIFFGLRIKQQLGKLWRHIGRNLQILHKYED